MWNERKLLQTQHGLFLHHILHVHLHQKANANQIGFFFISVGKAVSFFNFHIFFLFIYFFIRQQCTTLYGAEYLWLPSAKGLCREPFLPCWSAWMFCIETRFNSLRVCGKVTHGALIRADKKGKFNLCFKCCERSENSQTSHVVDEQRGCL